MEGFDWDIDHSKRDDSQGEFSFVDDDGTVHKFRFVNKAPLNDTHTDLKVNFLEYWEINKDGKILYHNTWISDIEITQENAYTIARGGRARWHIESVPQARKTEDYHENKLKLCA